MRKFIVSGLIVLWGVISASSQIYIADSCKITLYSPAPGEDIKAVNTMAKPLLSEATNDIQFRVSVADFVFQKELMREQFNKDYMESDKYPDIEFKGKINEKVEYKINGINKVSATGTLSMHGVNQNVTIPGSIRVFDGYLFLNSNFNICPSDYNIFLPKLNSKNLAESVSITISAGLGKFFTKK